MDEIYELILAKLDEIPELNWIDLDKGQLDTGESRPPVAFPCALIGISFPNASDLDLNQTIQDCSVQINIRIAQDFTGNTSAATPQVEREKSLVYMRLVQKVYEKLQGFSNGSLNPLSRRNQQEERRNDLYKVMRIGFVSEFEETI